MQILTVKKQMLDYSIYKGHVYCLSKNCEFYSLKVTVKHLKITLILKIPSCKGTGLIMMNKEERKLFVTNDSFDLLVF